MELQPDTPPGLLQIPALEGQGLMKGWQAEEVPLGAFLRLTTAMFLGRKDQLVLSSKRVRCFGCQWVPTPYFRDGLGTGQSTDLSSTRKENLSPQHCQVTRSRVVTLLGINPAVCQTHAISQGVKLVPQSEAAFQEFSRARLASAL